jgi:hypothetical protein
MTAVKASERVIEMFRSRQARVYYIEILAGEASQLCL